MRGPLCTISMSNYKHVLSLFYLFQKHSSLLSEMSSAEGGPQTESASEETECGHRVAVTATVTHIGAGQKSIGYACPMGSIPLQEMVQLLLRWYRFHLLTKNKEHVMNARGPPRRRRRRRPRPHRAGVGRSSRQPHASGQRQDVSAYSVSTRETASLDPGGCLNVYV